MGQSGEIYGGEPKKELQKSWANFYWTGNALAWIIVRNVIINTAELQGKI